jgi:hypothetical protein
MKETNGPLSGEGIMRKAAAFLSGIAAMWAMVQPCWAGHFVVAFQRQLPAWENNTGTGCLGSQVCRVWVWDEKGKPVTNLPLKTSWNILVGTTDIDGRAQITIYQGDDIDLTCVDGVSTSEVTRLMTTNRPDCWGHYSFEVGFLYKTDIKNPGQFDLNLVGTWNEPTPAPQDNDAPYTKSLAYNSVVVADYRSDTSILGNWQDPPSYFGQTFVATGNRIVAARVEGTIGFVDLLDWNLQVLSFPDMTPVGLPTSVPVRYPFGWEAFWGVNECPVVPGKTYMLKIWRTGGGMNIYHVNKNVYPQGQYYEGTKAFPEYDLNGHVCCMNYPVPRPVGLAGLWEMGDVAGQPAADASGQGHNGTIQGTPLPVGGMFGNGLQFDGDDSITIAGYKGISGSQPRTCAAWVWIDPTVTSGILMRWGSSGTGRMWQMRLSQYGSAAALRLAVDGGSVISTTPINLGRWVHVAVVLPEGASNTSDLRLFIDGWREPAERIVVTPAAINTAAQEDMRIGTNGSESFVGRMDDMAVFDMALTGQQIARLYSLSARSFLAPCGHAMMESDAGRAGDIDRDCIVNISDLSYISRAWLREGLVTGDINGDGSVTLADAAVLAADWLAAAGLMAHWPFDEATGLTVADRSGHHNDAQLRNMNDQDWVVGRLGNALQFDGADKFMQADSYTGISGSHARTCTAWIRTTMTSAGTILSWGRNDVAGGLWELRINSAGQLRIPVSGGGINGTTAINTGQWVHVAAVLPYGADNSGDIRLYVNGTLEAGGAVTAQPIDTRLSGPVRIGGSEVGTPFTGTIDDVRIYNRALTAEEILQLATPLP